MKDAVNGFLMAAMVAVASVVCGTQASLAGETQQAKPLPTVWEARINRPVYKQQHLTWTLRRMVRLGDELHVHLAFKNNGNNRRPVLLEADYKNSARLIGEISKKLYPLVSVEGISDDISMIDRRATREAKFVFQYPEEDASVVFSTRWLTMLMRNGAATVLNVDFDLKVPPPEAKPGQ